MVVYAVKSAKGKKAKAYAVLSCYSGANLTAGLYSDKGVHSWTCGQQNFNVTDISNTPSVPIDGTANTYPIVKSISCQGCDPLKEPKGKKLTKCKGKAIKGPINDQ